MHRFYHPTASGDRIELSAEEAHHAVHVLRLTAGTRIMLLDGKGNSAVAELTQVEKRGCWAMIIERAGHVPEHPIKIHIACAPTKQIDRFEWMLEKCTEIGVDRITPLMTSRTERGHLRMDRMQKVLVSAMKQSQRAWLPLLDAPITIGVLMGQDLPAQRFFGWCEGEQQLLTSAYQPTASALCLIGPEGDLTAEEASQLNREGFLGISLGSARLRTETAAVAAATWMSMRRA